LTNFRIAIPSKGRPDKQSTYDLLAPHYRELIYIFVEPQDYDAYKEQGYPNLVNIGSNNMGVAFVRNKILDHFHDVPYLIQPDDDIFAFYKRNLERKYEVFNLIPEVIDSILEILPYAGYVGMPVFDVAWRAEKSKYSWGRKSYSFSAFNLTAIQKLGIRYDEKLRLFEDIDIQMQTMLKGVETCTLNRYSFRAWSGDIKKKERLERSDGCFSDWNATEATRCSCYILEKYGEKYVKLRREKKARMNFTVNWKRLREDGRRWLNLTQEKSR